MLNFATRIFEAEHVRAVAQLPVSFGPPFLQSAVLLTTVTTFTIINHLFARVINLYATICTNYDS